MTDPVYNSPDEMVAHVSAKRRMGLPVGRIVLDGVVETADELAEYLVASLVEMKAAPGTDDYVEFMFGKYIVKLRRHSYYVHERAMLIIARHDGARDLLTGNIMVAWPSDSALAKNVARQLEGLFK